MAKKFNIRGMFDGLRQSVSSSSPKSESDIEETIRSEDIQVAKTVRHGFPYQPTAMAFDSVQHILAIGTKSGSLRIFGQPGVDLHCHHGADVSVLQILFLVNEGALVTFCSDDNIHLWNYRQKRPEIPLRSISWHSEGKQFMSSHSDGSLLTWNVKTPGKPASIITPHAKPGKDGKTEQCKPITKVEWKSVRNGDPLVIFSGGMSYDRAGRTPCITVMTGKTTTVLEMEHTVIDFVVMCETPWQNDFQDPYAIVVLLQNDLVVIDLTSPGYPCFENPYPMDIHESPVTACQYFADCQTDLIPALYSVGSSKQKRSGFSEKRWPIKGGEWGASTCSYPEIVVTGHADGTVKFWDASAVTLQVLYKLKTAKLFEKPKNRVLEGQEDDPFAIYMIYLDQESRLLTLAGATHVMLFKFSKSEATLEVPSLDVSIVYEVFDDLDSPELDYPKPSLGVASQHNHSGSMGSHSSNASDSAKQSKPSLSVLSQQQKSGGSMGSYSSDGTRPEQMTALRVRPGSRKYPAGYHPDVVCLLTWTDNEHPGNVTSICTNSNYGLLAFGNESGLAIVDIVQKSCLLNLGTPDLYGSMDPYQRAPRSPRGKKPQPTPLDGSNPALNEDGARSPTSDQPVSPDSLTPQPPPRRRRPSKKLVCISENERNTLENQPLSAPILKGQSFQFSNEHEDNGQMLRKSTGSPIEEVAPPDLNLIPPTPLVLRKENENREVHFQLKPTNQTVDQLKPVIPKKALACRTSSLPLVPMPRDLVDEPITSKSKSQSHENFPTSQTDPCLTETEKTLPQRINSTDSDPEVKHHSHSRHKYTIKSFKKRLKHGGKRREKSSERNHKTIETSDNDQGLDTEGSHDDLASHGSRSENEEYPLTDEDVLSPSEESVFHEGKKDGFFRRMSVKMKMFVGKHDDEDLDHDSEKRLKRNDHCYLIVTDLTDDTEGKPPVERKRSVQEMMPRTSNDKNDGSSFSRSRSSSMSSLENVSREAIHPCLWVGTSLGSVLVIVLNLPPSGDQRLTQPVIVSPSGTIFRLKGPIQCMSFLDCNGVIIPTLTSGAWRDSARDEMKNSKLQSTPQKLKLSPSSSTEVTDRQFAIICSEKQARVVSLPSQTCPYKARISENSFVVKADVVNLRGDSVCLACYVANGHIMVYSLPSLKLLLDIDFLPLSDLRVARTFCFSNIGHAMYMCSPTELQKITYSAEFCDNLSEMLGELFLPMETPEPPKQGFFKNLFGGGPSMLDREELFGESSGKSARGLATRVPGSGGIQGLQSQTQATVAGEVSRARQLLSERGEKLSGVSERTEEMAMQAEAYSNTAHQIMLKYKDKKWYQF
ncbi:STXB5-like protein [Mya arenaria]|uniref:STXB5-like protein n=1 Tax=Mya arenaria TaxID=6604 RepID=A0ABY7ECH6_MYAAR|nr:STXB5-like protein [Mya arenaria]